MMRSSADALLMLDRLTGDDSSLRATIQEEILNSHVASLVYNARLQAGLTQDRLADRIGVETVVIADVEEADYDGSAIAVLQRVAAALDQEVKISLSPAELTPRS